MCLNTASLSPSQERPKKKQKKNMRYKYRIWQETFYKYVLQEVMNVIA